MERLSASDIAELAGVERSTVSNWRQRHDDFPKVLPDSGPRPQFSGAEVRKWLATRYPALDLERDHAADLVRSWKHAFNGVQDASAEETLILLLAHVCDDPYDARPDEERRNYAVIRNDTFDIRMCVEDSTADLLEKIAGDADGLDRDALIAAIAEDYDAAGYWRRTTGALAADANLRDFLASLVSPEATSVLDLECGPGALLNVVGKRHPTVKLIGLEHDFYSQYVAAKRLAGRGGVTREGSLLKKDLIADETYDVVLGIEPVSSSLPPTADVQRRLSFATASTAEAAWPQLAVQSLTPGGSAYLILPRSASYEERSDPVRRQLVREGAVVAIVTLPANAYPLLKTPVDLWVLRRPTSELGPILFADMTDLDPTQAADYAGLGDLLLGWASESRVPDDDPRIAKVSVLDLLGPNVNLDPEYWSTRASTSASADELLKTVENASREVIELNSKVRSAALPNLPLTAQPAMVISVRQARDEDLLSVVKIPTMRERDELLETFFKPNSRFTAADAAAMRAGNFVANESPVAAGGQAAEGTTQLGDVLVWVSSERTIDSTVCTVAGLRPVPSIAVLRTSTFNPQFLAMVLQSRRNAVRATGKTGPALRVLELEIPHISRSHQNLLVAALESASEYSNAARTLASAVNAWQQAATDAMGSGMTTFEQKPN